MIRLTDDEIYQAYNQSDLYIPNDIKDLKSFANAIQDALAEKNKGEVVAVSNAATTAYNQFYSPPKLYGRLGDFSED